MLKYKQDFNRVQKAFDMFWEGGVDKRPLVAVVSTYNNVQQAPYVPYLSGFYGDWDNVLRRVEDYISTTYYGGEAIPTFECTFGPDQYAGFFGGKIECNMETHTSWIHPFVNDFSKTELNLDFSPQGNLCKLENFIKKASDYADGKFLINVIDLHSNMDALAAMRGPQNLLLDLYDCEKDVLKALDIVRKTYPVVYDKLFSAGNMKKWGSIGWAPTYCRGKFGVIQCDFSCMISPDFARKFCIDAIAEEASYLDRCVYHFDGKDALGHLDDILAIKDIDVIQWVPGTGQPRTIDWMELLQKIQRAGKGLWIYDWTVDEIKANFCKLKPEKLIFSVAAKNQSEADSLLEHMEKNM